MLGGDRVIFSSAVLIYMSYCLKKTKGKTLKESHLNADVFLLWCCRGMNLEKYCCGYGLVSNVVTTFEYHV